jgi:hypothetical protein
LFTNIFNVVGGDILSGTTAEAIHFLGGIPHNSSFGNTAAYCVLHFQGSSKQYIQNATDIYLSAKNARFAKSPDGKWNFLYPVSKLPEFSNELNSISSSYGALKRLEMWEILQTPGCVEDHNGLRSYLQMTGMKIRRVFMHQNNLPTLEAASKYLTAAASSAYIELLVELKQSIDDERTSLYSNISTANIVRPTTLADSSSESVTHTLEARSTLTPVQGPRTDIPVISNISKFTVPRHHHEKHNRHHKSRESSWGYKNR